MPLLHIFTNVTRGKIPKQFLPATTKLLAELLSKPVETCSVHVLPEQLMDTGGSDSPMIIAQLSTIDRVNKANNAKFAPVLNKHLSENLGVDGKRCKIVFHDLLGTNIAKNGSLLG